MIPLQALTLLLFAKSSYSLVLAKASYSSAPIGGECLVWQNCSQGLSCIEGTCACERGKTYNPDYNPLRFEECYGNILSNILGACQGPYGSTCKTNSDCLTDACDQSKNVCTCNSGRPVVNGTQCSCNYASMWKNEFNNCGPYSGALWNSNVGNYVCEANTTMQNDATKSCDCLGVKGDPNSGIVNDSKFFTISRTLIRTHEMPVKGWCDCISPLQFNAERTKCVCSGAAALNTETGECIGYTNAQLYQRRIKGASSYRCPSVMIQNDKTKSCD